MSAPPLIGSLCSGYGGLDLGVMTALGGQVAWHAEVNPHAARILDHRWPGIPNLGDITAVDWTAVQPVCVLTAGFPCQRPLGGRQARGARPGYPFRPVAHHRCRHRHPSTLFGGD
jgi:hypothetical protein